LVLLGNSAYASLAVAPGLPAQGAFDATDPASIRVIPQAAACRGHAGRSWRRFWRSSRAPASSCWA